ncbi:MAG: alpha/beta hydrolase [Dehalococcoidales bacterium]|nr:alpha/beta hydrolase [Dehalococcoidales bacterium]
MIIILYQTRISQKERRALMPFCNNNGVNIYYEIEGSGSEVILIHGFSSNMKANWQRTGVTNALKDENQVIMIDCRGHGKSEKFYDPIMYGDKMLDDIIYLLDYLDIKKINLIGYSMGSRISLDLLQTYPERFKSIILGGFTPPACLNTNIKPPNRRFDRDKMIEAFLTDNPETITDPIGRKFRNYATSEDGDLKALAAVLMNNNNDSVSRSLTKEALLEKFRDISVPLMTISANNDTPPGDKAKFAMMVPQGCHFQIEGKNHQTVTHDPKFSMIIRAFLNYVNQK